MQTLSLIQLNIEGRKHFERFMPFLKEQNPEVVCLQEIEERDVATVAGALDMDAFFVPMALKAGTPEGVCILSKFPINARETILYGGSESLTEFIDGTVAEKQKTQRYLVALCDIEKDGTLFKIGTTHFTWTPDGKPDDFQRHDVASLLAKLEPVGDLILTGDFNAPRKNLDGTPGEIFARLAERYTDNVPPQYETSIDQVLHKAAHLPSEHMDKKMVDGIFSTPTYEVSNVEMVCSVSDHCALVADISRTN